MFVVEVGVACAALLLEQFYRTGCRENKLDTDEERISQRMRTSHTIRIYCQSKL